VSVTEDVGPGPLSANVTVTVTASGCRPSSTFIVPVRVQIDVAAEASATDALDAVPSVWTPAGDDGAMLWTPSLQDGLDRIWKGADAGTNTDTSLVSPALVAGDGNVVVTFDHKFDFEFSQDTYFDGCLIEVTTDDGATWQDVAMYTSPGYNGTIGAGNGNPLEGAMVYGATNPSFPGTDRVTLDFGAALADQTFKLRFRIVTDAGVGAPGWEIDDIAVTGISNTPFPTQTAEDGSCGPGPDDPPGDEGGCCSTGGARPSDIAAAGLLGLALVLRRRRRQA
jgi:MYXO-CTERM domain-containing protein